MSASARVRIQVKPRASKDAVEGWKDGVLIVRLTAPPVEGAANSSLIKLLAKGAGVARSRVHIVSGERGRSKLLEFEGVTLDELKDRFR
ncbi:MAG: DUF167 domain-containing protein [bacterium]|nr:DUF167 domain-containing protein [bacterium]MDT8396712.1 DUF167 domain-containing protein [bacterium]